MREDQKYYDVVSGAWSLDHTEEYTYDPALDYLTDVNYDVGGTNETRSWTYDAAGNRSSDSANSGTWTYDNLNRMTASPKLDGVGSLSSWTYSNDILGNRTNRNYSTNDASSSYSSWDVLNRMLVCAGPSSGASYSYRADGQRIEKVDGPTLQWTQWTRTSGSYDMNYATNRPTSRYFYDGQMGFEDDYNPSGSVTLVNRYALGARGIDRVERTEGSTTTYGYPLYDGHGNMRTTLARNGSGYTTGTFKTYDVWGTVRSGGDSTDPKQKYVASLGHVADDESGLTYMRARYHEPSTGRFISEDPAMDGPNWFVYASNNPVTGSDRGGKSTLSDDFNEFMFNAGVAAAALALITMIMGPRYIMQTFVASATAVICFGLFFGGVSPNEGLSLLVDAALGAPLMRLLILWTAEIKLGIRAASRTVAFAAVAAMFTYALACWGALLAMDVIDGWSNK